MKRTISLLTILYVSLLTSMAQTDTEGAKFIDALMARMTLDEKIGQLNLQVAGDITTGSAQDTEVGGLIAEGKMGGVFNLKGVEPIRKLQEIAVTQSRLGIPLVVGMDVIHGYETIFPIPLAQSMSWDEEAIENAAAISVREATADGINWVYSPMVDICLDPRWGRIAESNGEDPYLVSRLTKAYVRGYQGREFSEAIAASQDGQHPTALPIIPADRAIACVKHYALYGASEAGRDYNTVDMSRLRMYNQYLPPYKASVEAGVGSVMTSFNVVDGIPATTNKWLIDGVLRHQWGFDGMVVTDYGSLGEVLNHGTATDMQEASVQALLAGTDMDMCTQGFLTTLTKAVGQGDVSEADIDRACRRVLEMKWRLGLFQDPYRHCDASRRARDIYTDENRRVSRDFAAETFVLLKNADNTLPLKKEGKIALIGPLANDRVNIAGTWCVAYTPERYATVRESLEKAVGDKAQILYAQGCNLVRDEATQVAAEFGKTIPRGDDALMRREALAIAAESDIIVCAMGECADMSGESSSRADLHLPDVQMELLQELALLDKPIVLLNFSGRPTIMTWEDEHVDAILNVWFGGSEAGDAICDVLFGEKSPSGKLTATFPKVMGQIPIYYNRLNTGRPVPEDATHYYKYQSNYFEVNNAPLYPFGYGLSYTTFEYGELRLSATEMDADGSVTASVVVSNTGDYDADEIVQLYVRDMVATVSRPVKELKGFRRIHLDRGESQQVDFTIDRSTLSYLDTEGTEVLEKGDFIIMVGSNSKDVQTEKLTLKSAF